MIGASAPGAVAGRAARGRRRRLAPCRAARARAARAWRVARGTEDHGPRPAPPRRAAWSHGRRRATLGGTGGRTKPSGARNRLPARPRAARPGARRREGRQRRFGAPDAPGAGRWDREARGAW